MEDTQGLYLGKFAPFHKGHQFVVETALKEVDDLLILLYDTPNIIDVPAVKRSQHITHLYPEVEVIIAWGGPRKTGYTEEMKTKHEEFVESRIGGRNITHFFSSEFYGEHMSEYLDAVDYRVDPDRNEVPVSGTKIRNNTYQNREFVDPVVYFDLIETVALLGDKTGDESIKSKLASSFSTESYSEAEYSLDTNPSKIESIMGEYRKQEFEVAHDAKDIFFTDSLALNLYALHLYHRDTVPTEIIEYAREEVSRYDEFIFLDKPDIKDVNSERFSKLQRSVLDHFGINYTVVKDLKEAERICGQIHSEK